MIETLLRLLVLGLVLAGAFALTAWLARRRGPVAVAPLPPGVTVVIGPHCRLCAPAVEAIRATGVEPNVIDGPPDLLERLRVRSLPTAFVVDEAGEVVARRTGPAVLREAAVVARTARELVGCR